MSSENTCNNKISFIEETVDDMQCHRTQKNNITKDDLWIEIKKDLIFAKQNQLQAIEELFSSQNNRTENIKFSTYDECI